MNASLGRNSKLNLALLLYFARPCAGDGSGQDLGDFARAGARRHLGGRWQFGVFHG